MLRRLIPNWRELTYPFIALTIVYVVHMRGYLARAGFGVRLISADAFFPVAVFVLTIIAGLAIAALDSARNNRRNLTDWWRGVAQRVGPHLNMTEALRLVVVSACFTLTLAHYVSQKTTIMVVSPENFDSALMRLDRALHFGYAPFPGWHFAFQAPWWTFLIDFAYWLWYIVKFPAYAFFIFGGRARCGRFFTAFCLLWMIGGWMASFFPSFGPCFLSPGFALPQNTIAFRIQHMLAAGYYQVATDPSEFVRQSYEGIAAFPSLHVGLVALIVCGLWQFPRLRLVAIAYWFVIQYGSVYLGWHYAVDGYVMSLVAVATYIVSKWLMELHAKLIPSRTGEAPESGRSE